MRKALLKRYDLGDFLAACAECFCRTLDDCRSLVEIHPSPRPDSGLPRRLDGLVEFVAGGRRAVADDLLRRRTHHDLPLSGDRFDPPARDEESGSLA